MEKNMPDKAKKIAIIVVFLLCIGLPGLPLLPSGQWDEAAENRFPAPTPELTLSTLEAYPAGFEAWYNDAFSLRSLLLELYRGLKWQMGDSISPKNLQGRNGWIFYELTVGDYKNYTVLTEDVRAMLAGYLGYSQQLADEYGAALYMFIGPNKSEIYPEYMPARIRRNQDADALGDLEAFIAEDLGIAYIPVRQVLLDAKDEYPELYYPQGTHWNTIAGYFAYREVFTRIAEDFPSVPVLQPDEITQVPSNVYIGPNPTARQQSRWADVSRALAQEWEPVGGPAEPGTVGNGLTVLVVCDSFMEALYGYAAGAADEMVYIYGSHLTPELLEEVQPDIIVLEIVQRDVINRAEESIVRQGTGE